MSKPQWDFYVFDWDGTIRDTIAIIVQSIEGACREVNLPLPTPEQSRSIIGMGLQEAMAHICPQLPENQWLPFIEAYKKNYFARDSSAPLCPGMKELLTGMHKAGLRLAVATGKSRLGLNRGLALTGLGPLFEATITADETFSKPNPAMLEVLAKDAGVDFSRMVMIGDSIHDLQMANNAKVAGIGVTWGAGSRADLEGCAPRALVSSAAELAAALGVSDVVGELPTESAGALPQE